MRETTAKIRTRKREKGQEMGKKGKNRKKKIKVTSLNRSPSKFFVRQRRTYVHPCNSIIERKTTYECMCIQKRSRMEQFCIRMNNSHNELND